MTEKTIITITGPSTSGKSTLAALFKNDGIPEVVSSTTRPQRTGEKEGSSYYFISEDSFLNSLGNGEFVEHVKVGTYLYGVSKDSINNALKTNDIVVLVVEPHGANQVAEFCAKNNINIHKVFINNDMNTLIERLQKRFYEDKNAKLEVYQERLWNIAVIEPKEWTEKAYNGEHHYNQIFDSFEPSNQLNIKASILSNIQTNKKKSNLKIK